MQNAVATYLWCKCIKIYRKALTIENALAKSDRIPSNDQTKKHAELGFAV